MFRSKTDFQFDSRENNKQEEYKPGEYPSKVRHSSNATDDLENQSEINRERILESMRKSISCKTIISPSQALDLAKMKKITNETVDSKLLRLPPVNTMLRNERYNTLCLASTCNSVLALLGIVTSAIIYDIEYYDYWESDWKTWFQLSIFNTSITAVLIISIVWKVSCELDLQKVEREYSELDTILTSRKIYLLFLETALNLVHPFCLLKGIDLQFYNGITDVHYTHSLNSLLCVFVLVRLYHIFNLILISSQFYSGRALRVCKMNGVLANRFWVLKCILIAYPFRVVSCMLIVGIFAGGYCLRIFERPLSPPDTTVGFFDLGNAMWCIIITMTTVGFGDLTPSSVLGRIVGTLICIWGVFVVALMVVGVNTTMGLDSGQAKSFVLYERLKFKEYFKILAVTVLQSAFRFRLFLKRFSKDDANVSIQKSLYKRKIIEFQKARVQQKILYHLNTPEKKIEDSINICLDYAEKNLINSQRTLEKLKEIQSIMMQKTVPGTPTFK